MDCFERHALSGSENAENDTPEAMPPNDLLLFNKKAPHGAGLGVLGLGCIWLRGPAATFTELHARR